MNAKSVPCPNCGQPAAGRFCSHCGTAIVSSCPSCGTAVKPGTRVCHACGTSLTAPVSARQWGAQTLVPWVAIGIATLALVVALLALIDRGERAPTALSFPLPLSPPFPAAGQPAELAGMTPRQAADSLFNRVMAAGERGDKDEALRFVPMALQAYERLGTLDNDAHYHVALIHLTAGDIASARVHIDNLKKTVPRHLLAIMLEHQIAAESGNQAVAARAYQAFLAAYDAEIVVGRSEYQDHASGIERFRKAAQASTAKR